MTISTDLVFNSLSVDDDINNNNIDIISARSESSEFNIITNATQRANFNDRQTMKRRKRHSNRVKQFGITQFENVKIPSKLQLLQSYPEILTQLNESAMNESRLNAIIHDFKTQIHEHEIIYENAMTYIKELELQCKIDQAVSDNILLKDDEECDEEYDKDNDENHYIHKFN